MVSYPQTVVSCHQAVVSCHDTGVCKFAHHLHSVMVIVQFSAHTFCVYVLIKNIKMFQAAIKTETTAQ